MEKDTVLKKYEQMLSEEGLITEATLTRQHFIALAAIMKNAKTLDALKEDLLDWLRGSNPLFDEDRFRKAAGM
jgi:hypothetical protein